MNKLKCRNIWEKCKTEYGLRTNENKTNVMKVGEQAKIRIMVDGENLEQVEIFTYRFDAGLELGKKNKENNRDGKGCFLQKGHDAKTEI